MGNRIVVRGQTECRNNRLTSQSLLRHKNFHWLPAEHPRRRRASRGMSPHRLRRLKFSEAGP
ncbi:hypothetical protein BP1258A_3787 [Burkholderia pseudomallei 1258a]|uniref:Uncharacterized protein n=1 Tax=Burkholderia pseudomallei (strain 1026b) TaxID=884204 RepID=A0A0H3HYR5_BURP2|nr:hypothetical protein BP1026B_II1021 [Burkholderia pseudomallei 1026b]EIF59119.1 hypothetical protein BP1258A_3787 [Burkholderia pseudomallei 1258a]EIF59414.1 hypothetical protein BP1258B_4166 [Burkholderia pseudomallei 1258b]EIF60673.1 hypothetical protein BP1026A_2701 [Burkholderia pseudomallei 1026a]EIF73624.1 hypothetical protein BP354E_3474 [Burkholderia pseudomallei 354e]EIF78086.1 hypothetical protein BP354A_4286 [Burkholderia pseudomallei 354a]